MDILGWVQGVPDRKGKRPTLAVLSPYNRQIERMGRAIDDIHLTEVGKLNGFVTAKNASGFESTVDSFQGSEADLVVVSLVRNNDHVGRSALGILMDPRRMNVLLSRAKWKLVLVGSLEFLRVQARRMALHDRARGQRDPFLPKMIEVFDRYATEETHKGGPPKFSIIDAPAFRKGQA
jgi:superfamily I DNA and/or RNA helicase